MARTTAIVSSAMFRFVPVDDVAIDDIATPTYLSFFLDVAPTLLFLTDVTVTATATADATATVAVRVVISALCLLYLLLLVRGDRG